MIGLPTETDEDLVAIRDLTLQLREIMLKHARGRGHIGRIVGSVNPLVPKPGTAYQWLPMEDDGSIERKIKRMRSLMAGIDNVYFNIKSERHSFYQALLSLGDRRVAPAIEAAERNGGNWRAAVAEAGVDADFFVFRDRSRRCGAAVGHHRRRHEGQLLPIGVRQGAARRVDAAAEAAEGECASPPGAPVAGGLKASLGNVTFILVLTGTGALLVLLVVLITGGFVIDAGPLHFSSRRWTTPLVVASAAGLPPHSSAAATGSRMPLTTLGERLDRHAVAHRARGGRWPRPARASGLRHLRRVGRGCLGLRQPGEAACRCPRVVRRTAGPPSCLARRDLGVLTSRLPARSHTGRSRADLSAGLPLTMAAARVVLGANGHRSSWCRCLAALAVFCTYLAGFDVAFPPGRPRSPQCFSRPARSFCSSSSSR